MVSKMLRGKLMEISDNGFPRRNRVDLNTTAELAIRDAIRVVEEAGCDPLLTDAVMLLDSAREKVADFVDRECQIREDLADAFKMVKDFGIQNVD